MKTLHHNILIKNVKSKYMEIYKKYDNNEKV